MLIFKKYKRKRQNNKQNKRKKQSNNKSKRKKQSKNKNKSKQLYHVNLFSSQRLGVT